VTTTSAPQQLLKVAEVCERLRMGKSKVFEFIATGELESLKIDGARRVTEQAVDDFIKRRQAEAKTGDAA
jgi:excisionase family DNA binding protein